MLETILAVIIGGGVTYVGQWRLDSIRGKRERERDEAAAKLERGRDEAAAARERERDEAAALREREREEAATAAEVRVAMKLLLDELDTIALHHALLAKEQRYPKQLGPEGRALMFPTDVWETYKPLLARGLSDSAWEAITPIIHTVPRVRAIVLEAEPESPIPPEFVKRFRDGARMARDLYEALAPDGKPAPSVNSRGEPYD